MFSKNYIFPLLSTLIITLAIFVFNNTLYAQELPVEDLNPDQTIIDTIDYGENLLDSNEVYKNQFDSLSKEGEWVEIKKSEFLQELTESTGEDLDLSDIGNSTNIIYVWRPYAVDTYWNPYINGSWVFTNFGWVWTSYYNWGWAPYNYGRWYCSNYYGWVWFPGNVWAPNYVSWRYSGNYVGWYPTCPQFRWRGRGTHVYTNHLFAYNPHNWVFVNQKDFSKRITKNLIVKSDENRNLLKKSEKMSIATYNDPSMPKFKYKGPNAVSLANESGIRITPQIITAGNSGVKISNSKEDKVVTTGTENANIKNLNTSKNNNTSNSKDKNQIREVKKNNTTEKNIFKESNERSVKKNQENNIENDSKDLYKDSNKDTKKEKSIKNSDNNKSNSGSNSSSKNNSSKSNNNGKSIKKIR